MIHPHASCKYAVVFLPSGYIVVAVHGIEEGGILASAQFPIGDSHLYHPAMRVGTGQVRALAQTTEAAWKFKRLIEEQDREAEKR